MHIPDLGAEKKTVLHEWHAVYQREAPKSVKASMYWLGIAFLALAFLQLALEIVVEALGREHNHGLLSLGRIVVMFLMGFVLVAPKIAIYLIAVLPLPPFLRREGGDISEGLGRVFGAEAGKVDRRQENMGPPAGVPERRKNEQ